MLLKDVLSVPLEAVTSEVNIPYVYKKAGATVVKQEVKTGDMNDTHVVITAGVADDDVLLLLPPADASRLVVNRLTGDATAVSRSAVDRASSKVVPVKPSGTKPAPVKPTGKL